MERKTQTKNRARRLIAGNALVMIFMAVGMAGVVTYGLNNIMRGPAVTAAETSRRTITENNLVATTRLAITAAAQTQSNGGDCDQDGFVEPIPFRAAGLLPAPGGGGLVPLTIGASITDPWGVQYGYCVWDPGTVSQSDNNTACGNATGNANRLEGAPRDDQPAIAIISAGKNGTFDTTCNPYADTLVSGQPDLPLIVEDADSDDIVLSYTYAEANGIGGGLWRVSETDPTTAEIDRGIRSTSQGGASFGGAVELTNRGLVLPGDPGDGSVTGDCEASKDGQLRRNTFFSPPQIEMCDHAGGNGWIQISGDGSAAGGAFNPGAGNCTRSEGGPFFEIDRLNVGNPSFSGNIDHVWGIWAGTGQANQQIFATGGLGGVFAITFDGQELTFQDRLDEVSAGWGGIWSDGTNIFAGTGTPLSKLSAITFDGTNLTEEDFVDRPDDDLRDLAGTGDTVFRASGINNSIEAYRLVGSTLTLVDTYTYVRQPGEGDSRIDVWTDGTTIYAVGSASRLRALTWDGSNFSNPVVSTVAGFDDIQSDGTFIYTIDSWGSSTLHAYSFDGTTFTPVATVDVGSGAQTLWNDGVYIYVGTDAGISVYSFDGTAFQLIEALALPQPILSLWGDGNYIYAGADFGPGHWGDMYAFGGYACLGPNPEGGTPIVRPPSALSSPAQPDPLDVGLIAHWKMDEPFGETGVADSVGENDGTRLGNVTTTLGHDGGTAINLSKAASDAVRVDGLLGSPQQGTIAGWVNLAEPTIRASNTDRGMIISVGDYVNLFETYDLESDGTQSGLTLEIKDGGSWRQVSSTYQLTGAGWHYVVATFDTAGEAFRVYVDGNMVAEENQAWTVTYSGGGADTYFGRHGNAEADWAINGSLDDFRVYNRALGPNEVAALSKRHMAMGSEAASPLLSPLHIAGRSHKIAVGLDHGCGIKDDGTLWCWGMNTYGKLGNGEVTFGYANSHQPVPVQVKEPTHLVYYLNNINSALSVGGATFSKKMLPYLQQAQASLGTFAGSESKTAYGFTDPGMPGFVGASGNREYKVTMQARAADSCLAAGAIVARINAGGTLQSSVTLAANGSDSLSGVVNLTARGDLGTFAETDRLRVQYTVTNTCGSARAAPELVSELHAPLMVPSPWVSVTASTETTCGIKGDGSGWCWGGEFVWNPILGNSAFSSDPQLLPSRVVDLGGSWSHIDPMGCGIKTDGSLWCWGNDNNGKLGNGAIASVQHEPYRVGTDNDWASVNGSPYSNFFCATRSNGSLWCWGSDDHGQLGNGATNTDQNAPILVDNGPWVKVSAGSDNVCGIRDDSTLWCWGLNTNGDIGSSNIGTDIDIPTKIERLSDGWIDVSKAEGKTCGIRTDGHLYCFGSGSNFGLWWNPNLYVPQKIPGMSDITGVTTGYHNICVMKSDGAAFCMGPDNEGRKGGGYFGYPWANTSPTPVLGFPHSAGWSWNETQTIINAPYQFNVGIGESMIGDVGNNVRGFGFTSTGRARLYQDSASGVQLGIRGAAGGSAQTSFRTTPGMANIDVTTGLVARWSLDADANATTGGAGLNGTSNGNIFFSEAKDGAGSALFDGTNDFIRVNRSATIEPTAITVSLWARRTGNQAVDVDLLQKVFGTGAPLVSYGIKSYGNTISFVTGHTDNDRVRVDGGVWPEETWTHIVGTFNSSGTENVKLYINGQLVSSANKTVALRYDTTANGRFYLGGCTDSTSAGCLGFFKGAIDDVRIYSRAISANEVAQLYEYQSTPGMPTYSMGIDRSNDRFEIATNTSAYDGLNTRSATLNILSNGLTGIGNGNAAARLDVQGGVRFGSESACDPNREGAMRYTGGSPAWSYCNGATWEAFGATLFPPWRYGAIAGGNAYFCAGRVDGTAWCWGNGGDGQLGNGVATNTSHPQRTTSDTGVGHWSNWVQLSAGADTTCGIRADGTAWCWGYSGEGRMGNGVFGGTVLLPDQVTDEAGTGHWNDWREIGMGWEFGCGLRAEGTIWCWGNGYPGLGNGAPGNYASPVRVLDDTGTGQWNDWKDLSVAPGHACGIRTNGTLWCWGQGDSGRLGNGDVVDQLLPVQVTDEAGTGHWSDWVSVAGGNQNGCGIRADGSAWCWGGQGFGILGNNTGWGPPVLNPVRVHTNSNPAGWYDWIKITVGVGHTCGIRTDGTLWCWGAGQQGQMGNGDLWSEGRPVQVANANDTGFWTDWVDVKNGWSNTCALRSNGTLWCWGIGDDGALGNGTTSHQSLPVQVVEEP